MSVFTYIRSKGYDTLEVFTRLKGLKESLCEDQSLLIEYMNMARELYDIVEYQWAVSIIKSNYPDKSIEDETSKLADELTSQLNILRDQLRSAHQAKQNVKPLQLTLFEAALSSGKVEIIRSELLNHAVKSDRDTRDLAVILIRVSLSSSGIVGQSRIKILLNLTDPIDAQLEAFSLGIEAFESGNFSAAFKKLHAVDFSVISPVVSNFFNAEDYAILLLLSSMGSSAPSDELPIVVEDVGDDSSIVAELILLNNQLCSCDLSAFWSKFTNLLGVISRTIPIVDRKQETLISALKRYCLILLVSSFRNISLHDVGSAFNESAASIEPEVAKLILSGSLGSHRIDLDSYLVTKKDVDILNEARLKIRLAETEAIWYQYTQIVQASKKQDAEAS